jgi:glycosyltransferase involved in cell wall biosynthesis
MHILYIIDFYKPNKWWVEVLMEQIIEHFSKENKISIITWNFNWKLPEIEKKWNITIYRVKSKNLFTYTFAAYKQAKKIINDIDIIHWNTWFSALVIWKLAKKYKKKSIIHVHGLFWNFRNFMIEDKSFIIKKIKVFKFKLLEKLIISQKVDYFIAISYFVRDVLNFYYWVNLQKIKIIPNAIDEKKWLSYIDIQKIEQIKNKYSLKNKYNILFYGRIEKNKWWDFYLETIPNLNLDNTNYVFIIHWDFKKFTKKLINLNLVNKDISQDLENGNIKIIKNNLAKNSNFIIVPWLKHEELVNWIKACNLVVIPSYMEPFWLVWLEVSLLDTPIVASNTWALHEVVFGKVNFFQTWHHNSFKKAIIDSKNWIFLEIPYRDFSIKKLINDLDNLYYRN